jgi:predicted peroxiredoxin
MKKSLFLAIPIISVIITGCTSHPDIHESLGDFTAASSFDIRNLNYNKSKNTTIFVTGEACYQVDRRTLIYISGPKNNLIQKAMDDAIRKGQKTGIDGDLLVNVRIEKKTKHKKGLNIFANLRYECVYVSGDLVRIETNKTKQDMSTPKQSTEKN